MKIFKKPFKKPHFGGGGSSSSSQDPGRSGDLPPPSPSSSAASPSCESDHRAAVADLPGATPEDGARPPADYFSSEEEFQMQLALALSAAAPSAAAPEDAARPAAAAAEERENYFLSEEEFQMQMALALSASNSEFRADPDRDQIRAATLLSLGRHRNDHGREENGAADALSRRYWDYNVLDYNEKVIDGFYDIFGFSSDSASQGKMPSLVDLQTGIGDLGFEVVIVNRAIDPQLVELEQITHCVSLDCPAAQVGILVQRISELVMEHMGGPVRDANDMLARWMEKSLGLRTSLQTSLLPIGCIKVGLSRHRALLFKVLADNVGIPCRLVKGSHYTGVDDDAVNIIKLDDEREFLVDLMAAPGTLIPADVLSAKETSLSFCNPRLNKLLTPWTTNTSGDGLRRVEPSCSEYNGNNGNLGTSGLAKNNASDKRSRCEKVVLAPSAPSVYSGASSTSVGSSSSGNTDIFPLDQANHTSSLTSVTSSKQKKNLKAVVGDDNLVNEKLNIALNLQDTVDSRNLFAELNPLKVVVVAKTSALSKASDIKNSEYQGHRKNIPSGPGRSRLPLVWKDRLQCNEVPNPKKANFAGGLLPRKNLGLNDVNASSSSHLSSIAWNIYSEGPNVNISAVSAISYSPEVGTSGHETSDSSTGNTGCPSFKANSSSNDSGESHHHKRDNGHAFISIQSSEEKKKADNHTNELVLPSNMLNETREQRRNGNGKHDRNEGIYNFTGTNMGSKDSELLTSSSQAMPSRLDPMLDDASEWEIPWEDLVIGERIGLGSYGEVFRANWNGTEVAVKKFLDQGFFGDAMDEFRSEVWIMRRLRHPNVVLFRGAVTRSPNLSIVSEFLPRGSLFRILHRPYCQIDEKRRIKMALDVAEGMNCLHTSIPTIVHRDLKSPNLLIDNNWTVKVCDFGLSRLKNNTFLSSKSTAGTPEWMAPEVLRNEPSNEKCDVYSFGVILWELATLRMPWSGMNPMQVVGAVGFQERRLDIPKEIDPIVGRIIWECWQTDPSLRPSFAQLTTALKSLQRLVIPSHQEIQNPPLPQEISVNSTPQELSLL